MKAFGQIMKTLFILRYIDDLELRQSIEAQLNKVELANRFTRAIAVGNPREYTQGAKEDPPCSRRGPRFQERHRYAYLSRTLGGFSWGVVDDAAGDELRPHPAPPCASRPDPAGQIRGR